MENVLDVAQPATELIMHAASQALDGHAAVNLINNLYDALQGGVHQACSSWGRWLCAWEQRCRPRARPG